MKIPDLRQFTSARVSLGRVGHSLPTSAFLKVQLAEVYAREAVHSTLDLEKLREELVKVKQDIIAVESAAPNRASYIRRPDLGRRLNDDSRGLLEQKRGPYDLVFVIADGLSASAVNLHARPLLEMALPLFPPDEWNIAPLVVVKQGRVAIADEIGELLGARVSALLIGERPGLSASDSLGLYLTWNPRKGLTDADRNCISNIRTHGLSYAAAAQRLAFLISEARRLKLSGVNLKEGGATLLD